MSKLYVFAIGGTGIRVMNSLMMVLASGVSPKIDEIVPMIIDTDTNNGDLAKLRDIIKSYRSINSALYSTTTSDQLDSHFFRTKVADPKELNISGLDYGTLKGMLTYDTLISSGFQETKFLIDLLFNDQTLNISLEKGFLGNPNVGSIVLKNVISTTGFREFTTGFKADDRIFVISSIFGGTGAAGFPLLLNVFRDASGDMNNINFINKSIIGGVTVLPYFEVDVDKFQAGLSAINSNTFTAKTKAALSYYHKHLGGLLNALYFVGDTKRNNYENFEGGNDQINPNSFIELAASTAIIDFINYQPACSTIDDLPPNTNTKFFEFGIDSDLEALNLNHIKSNKEYDEKIIRQLIKFKYFCIYLTCFFEKSLKLKNITWIKDIPLPDNFNTSEFLKNIKEFCHLYFYNYLINLNSLRHSRRFIPFTFRILQNGRIINMDEVDYKKYEVINIYVDDDVLFTIVTDKLATRKNSTFHKEKIVFDDIFTSVSDEVNKQNLDSKERKFIMTLQKGLTKFYAEKFLN